MENTKIALFKGKKIRKTLFQKEWWFSVVDVVQALIDQSDDYTARKYWNKLAQRLRDEGSEVVTNCHRLKLEASDGKMRETDCADTEGIPNLKQDAKRGGRIAGIAKEQLEKEIGRPVVSEKNYLPKKKGLENKRKLAG